MNPLISFLSLSVYSPLSSLSLSTHSFPLTLSLSIHICIPTPFLSYPSTPFLSFSLSVYLLLFSLSLFNFPASRLPLFAHPYSTENPKRPPSRHAYKAHVSVSRKTRRPPSRSISKVTHRPRGQATGSQ